MPKLGISKINIQEYGLTKKRHGNTVFEWLNKKRCQLDCIMAKATQQINMCKLQSLCCKAI